MIWSEAIHGLMRSSGFKPSRSSTIRPASNTSDCECEWTSNMPNSRSTNCAPGLASVDLTAISTRRKTSLPGATSTYKEAMPSVGKSPWVIVPTNAAYCGCIRSRYEYTRNENFSDAIVLHQFWWSSRSKPVSRHHVSKIILVTAGLDMPLKEHSGLLDQQAKLIIHRNPQRRHKQRIARQDRFNACDLFDHFIHARISTRTTN